MQKMIEPIRMNLRDAAKYLGICERKFQHLVSVGEIRYVTDPPGRRGQAGKRFYPTAELRRYLDKQMREQWREVA